MSKQKLLVVATGNPGKVREMQDYLTDLGWELILKPDHLDIAETGDTFAANACLKARAIALATNNWAIADDSGLEVDALGGAPGIYSARYGQTDSERINRLLQELGNTTNRGAQFVCVIAIARSNGEIACQTQGICRGEIIHAPRGHNGFGYDPIFYVPSQGLTFAEMTPELKRSLSHRGQAIQALLPQIRALVE